MSHPASPRRAPCGAGAEPLATVAGRRGGRRLALVLAIVAAWFGIGPVPSLLAQPPDNQQTRWTSTPLTARPEKKAPLAGAHNQHPTTAAGYDETIERIDHASRLLQVAEQELSQRDLGRRYAQASVAELRQETMTVADETVVAAIALYQGEAVDEAILASEDINVTLRASALGAAAIGSNTEAFDLCYAVSKDLEIAEAELAYREEMIGETQTEIAVLDDELTEELLWLAEIEEKRLQEQAAVVATQASIRAQSRGRKQGFYLDTCPINGPHEFIDSWGFARSGGRQHRGVDMLADAGMELVAPVSGQVEHATNSLGGRVFRLVDDNGNYFYGAHLSAFGKEGRVVAGEVIGYVGDSGNAAGIDHLHFEIHPGGRGNPINPFVDTASVCAGAQG